MKLGLYSINGNVCALDPAAAIRIAQTAERTGWESVWTAEHYLLPDPRTPESPIPGHVPLLDPFVALANVAAHTETLLLATGVTVVPLHEPVTLAKRVMSLDRVSGGRFLFGVGAGYLAPEFAAAGVPLADRGRRMDEYLAAMSAIWTETTPVVDGTYVSFSGLRSEPRPIQQPGPPLHLGGRADPALRRAVATGTGWFGYNVGVEETAAIVSRLKAIEAESGRPAALGKLEITVAPSHDLAVDQRLVEALAELGVDRLIVVPPRDVLRDAELLVRFVAERPAALGVTA